MFVDKAKIHIKAGNGGDGAVAFHREKYVASGGPDGGDGGRGGNIVFQVDDNISTLADFRYKRKYKAQNGENGRGSRCNGKKAPDLIIKVPRGTVIREVKAALLWRICHLMNRLLRQKAETAVGVTLILRLRQGRRPVLQKAVLPARSGR